ncbi:hypothetical protein BH11PSE11_BH11PSE11_21680 [soil metagenome]
MIAASEPWLTATSVVFAARFDYHLTARFVRNFSKYSAQISAQILRNPLEKFSASFKLMRAINDGAIVSFSGSPVNYSAG